jgi:hypothetical protein
VNRSSRFKFVNYLPLLLIWPGLCAASLLADVRLPHVIGEPVAVRFAWHMLPEPIPNLVNREGLPASPFCTHEW